MEQRQPNLFGLEIIPGCNFANLKKNCKQNIVQFFKTFYLNISEFQLCFKCEYI